MCQPSTHPHQIPPQLHTVTLRTQSPGLARWVAPFTPGSISPASFPSPCSSPTHLPDIPERHRCPFLPQGLCTCCFLCHSAFPRPHLMALPFPSLRSLLKVHLREAFPDPIPSVSLCLVDVSCGSDLMMLHFGLSASLTGTAGREGMNLTCQSRTRMRRVRHSPQGRNLQGISHPENQENSVFLSTLRGKWDIRPPARK